MTIIGGDSFIDIPSVSASVNVDGERIGETVRRALESARVAIERRDRRRGAAFGRSETSELVDAGLRSRSLSLRGDADCAVTLL